MNDHLRPEGKPAPPRPRSPDFFIWSTIQSGPLATRSLVRCQSPRARAPCLVLFCFGFWVFVKLFSFLRRHKKKKKEKKYLDEGVSLLVQICEDAVLVGDASEAGALCRGRGRGGRAGSSSGSGGIEGRRGRGRGRRERGRGPRGRCGAVVVFDLFSEEGNADWNRTSQRACCRNHFVRARAGKREVRSGAACA